MNDAFTETIWQQGRQLYRDMPWRNDTRPYYVLVSELMLQQTQVARVIPKFEMFVESFPDEQTLARATLAEVLRHWQGLGYNRRAKYLHDAAKMIVNDLGSEFPTARAELLALPGVGKNTAGAIEAYAFNRPSLFIETNVRTVYIHHFYADELTVDDAVIEAKLAATIDREYPREFYWALMDYGSWLKSNGIRNISQSRSYKKQSRLEGSVRQVRGAIVRTLTKSRVMVLADLKDTVSADERFDRAFDGLLKDGLITQDADVIRLTQ